MSSSAGSGGLLTALVPGFANSIDGIVTPTGRRPLLPNPVFRPSELLL